eukprot:UN21267
MLSKITDVLKIFRDVFFTHSDRSIRFGAPSSSVRHPRGDPTSLRTTAPLRSLRSLHSLRKVSSKSFKLVISEHFCEITQNKNVKSAIS